MEKKYLASKAWLLAVALVAVAPCGALAQLSELREHARAMDSNRTAVGAAVGMFFGDRDEGRVSHVSPRPVVAHRSGEVVFELVLPLGYLHDSSTGNRGNDFRPGNVFIGASYLPDTHCGLSRISLGLAPPTAFTRTNRDRLNLQLGRGVQADDEGFLWMERTMPLVLGAGSHTHRGPLRASFDGDVLVGLPGGNRTAELGFQVAGDASLRLGSALRFGARLNGTWWPTIDGDNLQLGIAPYLRMRSGSDSLAVRFVMPIDGPSGFAFGENGVWGLHIFFATSI